MDITKIEDIQYPQEIGEVYKSNTRKKIKATDVNYCYFDIALITHVKGTELKSRHKGVLWALDSCGDSIFPSRETLSAYSGFALNTLDKAIDDLQDLGLLTVFPREGTSNLYVLDRAEIRRIANEKRERDGSEKREVAAKIAALKAKCDIRSINNGEGEELNW